MTERFLDIRKLREEKGLNYQQIGEKLGISRQRVHQLYKNYSTISVSNRKKILAIFHPDFCEICGKPIKYKDITIHHLDGNPKNNRDNNLVFCHYTCHRLFEGRSVNSREKHIARNPAKEFNKKCLNCGKTFFYRSIKPKTKRNFCSKECAKKHSKNIALYQFKCKRCGKYFYHSYRRLSIALSITGKEPQYCSQKCYLPPREFIKKTCLVCKKELLTKLKRQKYCSRKCFFEDHNRRPSKFKPLIEELYKSGKSVREISEILKISLVTVYKYIKGGV